MTSAEIESPLMSDHFINYKSKTKIKLELYANLIRFYAKNSIPDFILNLNDLAGSSIGKGHNKDDTSSYLILYTYIKNPNNPSSKRKRITYELSYSQYSTYEQNLIHVSKWHSQLDNILKKRLYSHSDKLKPFLVLVNPNAGSGKAKNIYFERVCPIFSEANLSDVLVFTQQQNFAREYVKEAKLDDFAAILVISGDGLMHEVINGLMERKDWPTAIKTPLGHIPGGSANALSCCVAYLSKEVFKGMSIESFAAQTCFNLTKSLANPLDLVAFELSDRRIVHSFLSFEWAIIADVDLESEKYRFLGGMRFALGAVKRIINLRVYRGRFSFVPADDYLDYEPKDSSIKINRQKSPIDFNDGGSEEMESKFKHLSPLDKPVPNNWLTIEEDFVLFLVTYLPLISSDFLASPQATFNDGHMHVIFIKQGITKTELLKLFANTENGDHLKHHLVEYVKVKAFRLEPIGLVSNGQVDTSNRGIMMVDGESVPTGPIQAEIMPSLGNILANLKE
ncbi:sphingosine kinase 1 [Brachionus plicatilis]|uniref:Sphingosine kinase 1 n=1 Tax=Brachionus plicatilis TaxID=10195 RepID=A0A3M7P2M4_BRAPC|nr:sphingosine kinase 1 [Brachionus plicatilis]